MTENSIAVPWYAEESGFFGPGYLREYEEILTNERTMEEVDFLVNLLRLKSGDKILDCPCGHGRHSVELALRGLEVTGQDINQFLLREAAKAAEDLGVTVHLVKGDMRKIPFVGRFDFVLNLFSSFGCLEDDNDDEAVLEQMAKALKQGGALVLDILNRDWFIHTYKEKDWHRLIDNSLILTNRRFDHISGRNIEERTRIWPDGVSEKVTRSIRMYTVAEIIRMLGKTGFQTKGLYGSYKAEPLTFRSKRCIFIAQKN